MWQARPLRRLIEWSKRSAASRSGKRALFFISAAESTVLPIAMELLLVPHMAANRDRVWSLATITLAGCLFGASLGYAVGLLLFDPLGLRVIEAFGWQQAFAEFQTFFDAYGFWAIVVLGVVPIPFQAAMLLAGLTHYPFLLFLLAALLSRGLRYYGLALLVLALGHGAEMAWRRHSAPVGIGLTLLLVVAFAVFVAFGQLRVMASPG